MGRGNIQIMIPYLIPEGMFFYESFFLTKNGQKNVQFNLYYNLLRKFGFLLKC